MHKEQIFQLKQQALNAALGCPGDLLVNAQRIYDWLTQEVNAPKQKAVNASI